MRLPDESDDEDEAGSESSEDKSPGKRRRDGELKGKQLGKKKKRRIGA
jgi:hypothetical protein